VSNSGVPDDAVISVRAGSVRKQGTMGSSKSFSFPNAEEGRLKFDVMSRIGTGNLVLKPASLDASDVYKVTLSEEMSCEVQVKRPGEHHSSKNLGIEDSPVKISAAAGAKEAKEYLESKGLLSFLQGVLHVVIKDKPDDPYTYMARCFMNGFDDVPHGTGHCNENDVVKTSSQATVHKDDANTVKGEKNEECKEAALPTPQEECKNEDCKIDEPKEVLKEEPKEETKEQPNELPTEDMKEKAKEEPVDDKEESAPPPDGSAPSAKEEKVAPTSVVETAVALKEVTVAPPAQTATAPSAPVPKEIEDAPEPAPPAVQQQPASAATPFVQPCGFAPMMAYPTYAPEAPMMVNYPMNAGAFCNGMQLLFI